MEIVREIFKEIVMAIFIEIVLEIVIEIVEDFGLFLMSGLDRLLSKSLDLFFIISDARCSQNVSYSVLFVNKYIFYCISKFSPYQHSFCTRAYCCIRPFSYKRTYI